MTAVKSGMGWRKIGSPCRFLSSCKGNNPPRPHTPKKKLSSAGRDNFTEGATCILFAYATGKFGWLSSFRPARHNR